MAKRIGLTKKIRFEVFKRDKFTCQYCGAKAPEVVLNVDHIDPVANGGGNDIINLITSCFDCNSGKRDKLLQDSSVLEKQRAQLELLQERREQIELMLEWKKSLSEFDADVHNMIADYINGKMQPWYLNDSGRASIKDWLKKYKIEEILDGIDIAATNYLKYDDKGITDESAELFISKIGGVLYVKSLPPIKQKLAYIKGIARNRFSYWDDRKGSVILTNYINALERHYDQDQVLNDLNKEVERITKSSKNWTEWRDTLEKWTEDIGNWKKTEEEDLFETDYSKKDFTEDQLQELVSYSNYEMEAHISLAEHLASIIPEFDRTIFRQTFLRETLNFLTGQQEGSIEYIKESDNARSYIEDYIQTTDLVVIFNSCQNRDEIKGFYIFEMKFIEELTDAFFQLYFLPMPLKEEYKEKMMDLHARMLIDNYDQN